MRTAREEPQLFVAPMVLALLNDSKTHTRRVVSARNSIVNGSAWPKLEHLDLRKAYVDQGPSPSGNPGPYLKAPWVGPKKFGLEGTTHRIYSRVGPGDRLWCKETWQPLWADEDRAPPTLARPEGWKIGYVATDGIQEYQEEDGETPTTKCMPSIFMRRWMSRVTLEITAVRVERLNDISEADAIAEGLSAASIGWTFPGTGVDYSDPRDAYAAGWESLHGPGSWKRNDWVWVRIFRRLR